MVHLSTGEWFPSYVAGCRLLVTTLHAGYRVTECWLLCYRLTDYLVTYWLPDHCDVKECCDGTVFLANGFMVPSLVAGCELLAGGWLSGWLTGWITGVRVM